MRWPTLQVFLHSGYPQPDVIQSVSHRAVYKDLGQPIDGSSDGAKDGKCGATNSPATAPSSVVLKRKPNGPALAPSGPEHTIDCSPPFRQSSRSPTTTPSGQHPEPRDEDEMLRVLNAASTDHNGQLRSNWNKRPATPPASPIGKHNGPTPPPIPRPPPSEMPEANAGGKNL